MSANTTAEPVPAEGEVTLASAALEATFLPGLGMLGTSLRHRGQELLAMPRDLEAYRGGHVTGLPLLAPWANRLGARRYEIGGVAVDLEGLALHTDPGGLPIHGTMTAQHGWEVVGRSPAALCARFDFGARPDLLASFPFPHLLTVDATVEGGSLRVATTVEPTGERPVPVAFGWHPYLRLPGGARRDVRLVLPARRHLLLDGRGLPTGAARDEGAEDAPLGERAFDDLYEVGDDRRLALAGAGRRLVVGLDEGYGFAQVFAPAGADFACLEPMTAPTNALATGRCALVPPGSTFTARFSLSVQEEPPA